MPEYLFGDWEELQEGQGFSDRKALRVANVHMALIAGIDGNPKIGCPSIVLNGGYVDDYDQGTRILYTGHGGNDTSSRKQIRNQNWDAPGNRALIVSELQGLPVRVTRGKNHKSPFSPESGYKYGGLYTVVRHFEDRGKDGFLICRYELEKIQVEFSLNDMSLFNTLTVSLQGEKKAKTRIPVTILRIVRDSLLIKKIKALYNYECQVCDIRIQVNNVPYAEGAHIRPLGKPHDGHDVPENLLCLCPNHHVMLDKGIIAINPNFTLLGHPGKLKVHKSHVIGLFNCIYHREHIYQGSK